MLRYSLLFELGGGGGGGCDIWVLSEGGGGNIPSSPCRTTGG